MIGWIMNSIVLFMVPTTIVGLLTVLLDLDCLFPVFKFILGTFAHSLLGLLLRATAHWIAATEIGSVGPLFGVFVPLMYCLSLIRCFEILQNSLSINCNMRVYVMQHIKHYKSVVLRTNYINDQFVYYHYPGVLLGLLFVGVLGNYGSIKLQEELTVYLFYLAPCTSVCSLTIILLLVDNAASVDKISREYLHRLKGGEGILRVQRKEIKSLRPIRISVGPFFYIQKCTKTTMLEILVNNTIALLLAI